MSDARRALPSVHALLESSQVRALLERASHDLVREAARDVLARARQHPPGAPTDDAEWARAVARALAEREQPSLRPVHNATGVVLHTNLGRAPLAPAALEAVRRVGGGFSNLEYDLETGTRGSRHAHCVSLLRELTGAADAMVANNGAAALLLALDTLARGRSAIVSRGELVEIGGSFRVPDIMSRSGARLVEVGTTNRTHPADYARAMSEQSEVTGAVVKVHRSNFAMAGFVSDVSVAALVSLAGARGVPVIHDLGSGLLRSLARWGLDGEPLAGDSVSAGATLITMSGDKLLGGPQAGILLGSAEAIGAARANPLARALRVDKLTLAALEATLALYRDMERAVREIPVLAMLTAPVHSLHERATHVAATLNSRPIGPALTWAVAESEGAVGGGAFPTARLPSRAVALAGPAAVTRDAEARLRSAPVPVIGRMREGELLLDLRSVPESADRALERAVREALA